MHWTPDGLGTAGFRGFVHFADLPQAGVPRAQGLYVVSRTADEAPDFLPVSPAGWFQDRDPTVSLAQLEAAWVPNAQIVYIGKATVLRERLSQYRRHGAGVKAGHWGGRYIWQLVEHASLTVSWMETTDVPPRALEKQLIADFELAHGRRPFANRVR